MVEVLLVEDHEGDVLLVQEAVAALEAPVTLHVVSDGAEAVRFLQRLAPYAERPAVQLVLLDSNTPRMNACEVLVAVRADPATRFLPVVVFSSSAHETDIRRCYEAGANAYVTKPMSLQEFIGAVQDTLRFWGRAAVYPDPEA